MSGIRADNARNGAVCPDAHVRDTLTEMQRMWIGSQTEAPKHCSDVATGGRSWSTTRREAFKSAWSGRTRHLEAGGMDEIVPRLAPVLDRKDGEAVGNALDRRRSCSEQLAAYSAAPCG